MSTTGEMGARCIGTPCITSQFFLIKIKLLQNENLYKINKFIQLFTVVQKYLCNPVVTAGSFFFNRYGKRKVRSLTWVHQSIHEMK